MELEEAANPLWFPFFTSMFLLCLPYYILISKIEKDTICKEKQVTDFYFSVNPLPFLLEKKPFLF